VAGTVVADREQARNTVAVSAVANAIEPFAQRQCNGSGLAFAGELGKRGAPGGAPPRS